MSEILVIGHRNPDTDSICAAIAYAEYKQLTGTPEAVAARCGDTNQRTDFVLQTFGVSAPKFVADVSPKVWDIMQRDLLSVAPDTTAAEALALMDRQNLRFLPVLDGQRRCKGLVSLFKVSQYLFPAPKAHFDSRRMLTSLESLARTLDGSLVTAFEPANEEELILMVGAMGLESFGSRLEQCPARKLAVVVGDRWDIQNLAIREGVRVIIVTGGHKVEPKTMDAALKNHVSLISSPHDTATTAALCRASIAVKHVLDDDFLPLSEDAAVERVRAQTTASAYAAFPVINEAGATVGILSKTDFLKDIDRKLILVDHNELSQAVQGAASVEILEIIDHHRIGALTTAQPILFRNEPVGSTCTIIAEMYVRNGVELRVSTAGLLLAGIISDTLNLTSPTTTPRDAEILSHLQKVSGVDARSFTEKLFASGSLLTSRPAAQAIATDCKEYSEGGLQFSVAQIEEIGFSNFWPLKADLMKALEDYRVSHQYDFSALLITDVVSQCSLLLLAHAPNMPDVIDYPRVEPSIYMLQEVVSRKKQLLPYLSHQIKQLRPVPAK